MENYIKGYLYEEQIKKHLLNTNRQVYLWHEVPVKVFRESKLFENYNDKLVFNRKHNDEDETIKIQDTGCDILYFNERSQNWIIVQCKNYTNTVTIEKLAGFYNLLLSAPLNGELFYTSKLSSVARRFEISKIKNIKFDFDDPSQSNDELKTTNINTKLTPRDYQVAAINKIKKCNRGILQLPCGMGKTLIMALSVIEYDIVILFSPLKQHAQQNLSRFSDELKDDFKNFILVDSDGTRDVEVLSQFLNEKTIFSSTFKSADAIEKLLEKIKDKNVRILVDECHNLNINDLFNEETAFCRIFKNINSIIFVSATPKIYNEECDEYVDVSTVMGKIEYEYSLGNAIQNRYVCDYDVFVPELSQLSNNERLKDVGEYLSKKVAPIEEFSDFDIKAHFLLRCLEENGHSKTIVYLKNSDEMNKFYDALTDLNIYHSTSLNIAIISYETKKKERTKILEEFALFKGKAIILSVRILDECIDIPKCDSVFLTYKQTNRIRTIQRICRSNRKDSSNPNKKSGIYMWADTYDDMCELIANLKEFDYTFTKEKVSICNFTNNFEACHKSRETSIDAYKKLDNVILKIKKVPTWLENFENLKQYININNKKPMRSDSDMEAVYLCRWAHEQNRNFRNKDCAMKNLEIYNLWSEFKEKYKLYYSSNEENWYGKLERVKKYMDANKCRPSQTAGDEDVRKLGYWITAQLQRFKTKSDNIKKQETWEQFYEQYKEYFRSIDDIWNEHFEKVKNYISVNKIRPSKESKDLETKKIGKWLSHQLENRQEKKGAFSNEDTVVLWDTFIEENKEIFLSPKEKWIRSYNEYKKYIDEKKKKPSKRSKDPYEASLDRWFCNQKVFLKKGKGELANTPELMPIWESFLKEYHEYVKNIKG